MLRVAKLWMVGGVLLAIYILSASCSTYVPPNMVGHPAGVLRQRGRHPPRELRSGPAHHRRGDGAPAPVPARSSGHQLQRFDERGLAALPVRRRRSRSRPATGTTSSSTSRCCIASRMPTRYSSRRGRGDAFEDRLVIPRVDRILRKTLGELNSEQFYQGPCASKSRRPRTISCGTRWRRTASGSRRCSCAATSTTRSISS